MRSARDIVEEYRRRGYDDTRLRALANGRPEPMRAEILKILDAAPQAAAKPAPSEKKKNTSRVGKKQAASGRSLTADDHAAAQEGLSLLGQLLHEPATVAPDAAPTTASAETSAQTVKKDDVMAMPAPISEAAVPEPVSCDVAVPAVIIEDSASTLFDMESKILDLVDGETEFLLIERDGEIPAAPQLETVKKPAAAKMEPMPAASAVSSVLDITEAVIAETFANAVFASMADAADEAPVAAVEATPVAAEEVMAEDIMTGSLFAAEEADCVAPVAQAISEMSAAPQMRQLTPIYSLRLTPEEYAEAYASRPQAHEIIDLTEPAAGNAAFCGEAWPAASEEPAQEAAKAELLLPHGQEKYRQVMAVPRPLQRSMEVLELAGLADAIEQLASQEERNAEPAPLSPVAEDECAAVAEHDETPMTDEQSNVISILPPYAYENAADLQLVAQEESAILQFPEPVSEAYDTIRAAFTYPGPATHDEELRHAAYEAQIALHRDMADEARAMYNDLERELTTLRRWVNEVEDALKLHKVESEKLSSALAERDETLTVQAREIETLRARLDHNGDAWAEADEWRQRYETTLEALHAARVEIEELEREFNILRTEKVPNLMQDKEDLVRFVEEQSRDETLLRANISRHRNHARLGYASAAAAVFLAVLSPVVHWANTASEKEALRQREESLVAQIQQGRRLLTARDTEISALNANWQEKIGSLQELAKVERSAWEKRNQELASLCKVRGEELDRLKENATSIAAAAPASSSASAQPASSEQATSDRPADLQRNEIRGVGEWLARANARTAQSMQSETSTPAPAPATQNPPRLRYATVQAGEGLSHVLWRETGISTPALVEWVIKANNLKVDRRGHPIIHPDQQLILPSNAPSVASAR